MSPPTLHEIDEIALSDEDIVAAMRDIPGYLDISTEDFRQIYHLAHQRALEHLMAGLTPARLMRGGMTPLTGDLAMDEAARRIVASGGKGLPVVDAAGRVIGILTETDFLRRLKANSFLELMLRLLTDPASFSHRCHETRVADAMTTPVVSIGLDADLDEVMRRFAQHPGRSMPVVDAAGRFVGMLLRKDFLAALYRRSCTSMAAEVAG